MTDRGQVRSLVAGVEEELGPNGDLVNCAGVMYYTLMKNRREEEWGADRRGQLQRGSQLRRRGVVWDAGEGGGTSS